MSNFPTFDPSRLTKKSAAAQYSSESENDDDDTPSFPVTDPSFEQDFSDLNPRKRRRVRDTKESAALGIFGSDSEDDGPSKQWKKKTLRGRGMAFVSTTSPDEEGEREYSGDGSQDSQKDDANEDDDEEEDEYDDDARPGIGLGFRPGPQSFGAREDQNGFRDSSMTGVETTSHTKTPRTKYDGTNPLGRGFVPSSAYQPVLEKSEAEEPESAPKMVRPSAFSSKNGAKGKTNPKSFGARMMAKMGYVDGQGLGKEGQGRNLIIEANLRPQGVGLGAVKEKSEAERLEEKRQARMRGEAVVDSDEEEERKKRRSKKKTAAGGAGSHGSTPRRHKTAYLTAEEIKKAAPGLHIPDAFAPILDMRGPENRLLTSTSGLLTPSSGAIPESTEVVEARKLVRRAQAELTAFSEEWRSLQDRKRLIDLEVGEGDRELTSLASDLSSLRIFSTIITTDLPSLHEWDDVVDCLSKAVDCIGTRYQDVADIAVSAIHPYFRDPEWSLLEEPARLTSKLKTLRGLLVRPVEEGDRAVNKWDPIGGFKNTDLYRQHHRSTTAYETMMYKLWFPKAMTAIRNWDVYEPDVLLAVLEAWDDLLPPFVRAQFLESVVRKLETAVGEWNPRKSKQGEKLPHRWLFPWLPYLPAYHLEPKGTGLVADVRVKFRKLIDVWDFDRGVVPGLSQWRDVLGAQWQPLVMGHVLPSMGRYLRRNFRIDPSDQEPYLPMLTGVLKWTTMLGAKVLGEVIVSEVFPLWHDKLSEWLGLEEMNLEEVYAWYEWWRDQVFPEEIRGLKAVKKQFEKGSMTIAAALENM